MATNYFEMMRDTVGAYGEGVDVSRRRRAEDLPAALDEFQTVVVLRFGCHSRFPH